MSFTDLPIVSLFFKNSRTIADISGYITISENTKNDLEITNQPVQQGAMITDHSFVKPTILSMQIQFDNSNVAAALLGTAGGLVGQALGGTVGGVLGGAVGGLLGSDVLADTYQKLLDLQASREPFTITTPKRIYSNMLFASLGLVTDKKTEKVLAISAGFQEVIIVKVTTTQVSRFLQQQPGRTGKTEMAGKKSALAVLKQVF